MTRISFLQTLGEWTRADGARYVRLAGAIRSAIERGDLAAGARLPAQRSEGDADGGHECNPANPGMKDEDERIHRRNVNTSGGRRWPAGTEVGFLPPVTSTV